MPNGAAGAAGADSAPTTCGRAMGPGGANVISAGEMRVAEGAYELVVRDGVNELSHLVQVSA